MFRLLFASIGIALILFLAVISIGQFIGGIGRCPSNQHWVGNPMHLNGDGLSPGSCAYDAGFCPSAETWIAAGGICLPSDLFSPTSGVGSRLAMLNREHESLDDSDLQNLATVVP